MKVESAITFVQDPLVNLACGAGVASVAEVPEAWVNVGLVRTVSRYLKANVHYEATPCTDRMPVVGDHVIKLDGRTLWSTVDASDDVWTLKAREVAIVAEVDDEGDFRLRNPLGLESGWILRSYCGYIAETQARRLLNIGVTMNYTIIVPANNREGIVGMDALEAIMTQDLGNFTMTLRYFVLEAIGQPADIQVTGRTQPILFVTDYVPPPSIIIEECVDGQKGCEGNLSSDNGNPTKGGVAGRASSDLCLHVATFAAAILYWTYVATLRGS
jgi:hypothetical protein